MFPMPELDPSYGDTLRSMNLAAHPKYVVAYGNSLFSTLRDARLMANALMDTVELLSDDGEYVYFTVQPGTWVFEASSAD